MSLSSFMEYFFSYYTVLGFIPAAVLCYMPMKNQLRFPVKRIVRDCTILFVVCYVGLQLLDYKVPWMDATVMLIPFLVVVFIYYIFSVKALLSQCAAFFVAACTLCAIPACFMSLLAGIFNPGGSNLTITFIYELIEIGLMVMICLLFMPAFRNSGGMLVENLQQPWIWNSTLPYSILVFVLLVVISSERYRLAELPMGRELFITIFASLSILYIISVVFFASVCGHIMQEERFRTRDVVYRIQKKQYEDVQSFLDRMHIFRHDTRHAMRTIGELAQAGDTAAILDYLNEKDLAMPDTPVRTFCENSILNAVLNYYLEEAERSEIVTDVKIDLPQLTDRQTVDLSSLLANLLENAILACREIPVEERQLALTVRTINKKTIYIVGTNTFNGKVKIRRGEYQSTRMGEGGSGIGLRSMRTVTERYRGTMKAYHEGNKFFVDIMMNVEKKTD